MAHERITINDPYNGFALEIRTILREQHGDIIGCPLSLEDDSVPTPRVPFTRYELLKKEFELP